MPYLFISVFFAVAVLPLLDAVIPENIELERLVIMLRFGVSGMQGNSPHRFLTMGEARENKNPFFWGM